MYIKEIKVPISGTEETLYVTDQKDTAEALRRAGEAVLVYLHSGNRNQDFSSYLFAVEDPEDLEPEYVERVYRRLKGLPWNILETDALFARQRRRMWKFFTGFTVTRPLPDIWKSCIRKWNRKSSM